MMFVVVSRTALGTMPFMLALFALLYLQCANRYFGLCVAAGLAAVVWNVSPAVARDGRKVRFRLPAHQDSEQPTRRSGSRLEFWQKSLGFLPRPR